MATQATLKANKAALRRAMGAKLRALPPSIVQAQSQKITERIISLPAFQNCQSVSCYLSMPTGEVQTSEIVSEILRAGKTLFVPKLVGDKMEFLKIYGQDDLQSLPSGIWGIPNPSLEWEGHERLNAKDEVSPPLDLVLMPGVTFDLSFSRLGHGKGFYDKFLASYAALGRKLPILVALAFQEQILEAGTMPMSAYDWKVDMIVGPEEVIRRENLDG